MRQITQSLSDLPYTLVNFGVDTLVLNVRYADPSGEPLHSELCDEYITTLNEWQAIAKEKEEPIATRVKFREANLLMHPHGAGKGQWRRLLTRKALNLCVSRGRLNGIVAQVRLSSELLWSSENPLTREQDLWSLLQEVETFLFETLGNPDIPHLHLQVSEIHLCADIAGWDVSTCFDWQATMLSRARRRVPRGSFEVPEPDECQKHGCSGSFLWQGPDSDIPTPIYNGHRLETIGFGSHGSALSCSIYNKSREIKKSGKTWFEPMWLLRGWDKKSDVWRIEFRWKREAIHNLKQEGVFHGIESVADLKKYLPYLWTYSAGHVQGGNDGLPDGWLRYVTPTSDKNMARWPVHPAWLVVQSAFTTVTLPVVNVQTGEVVDYPLSAPFAELIRERQREVNKKRLAQQIGGCCSTLSAWLTPDNQQEPLPLHEVFAWLFEQLPLYASPALLKQGKDEEIQLEQLRELLQEQFEATFNEIVRDKQVRYSLRSQD